MLPPEQTTTSDERVELERASDVLAELLSSVGTTGRRVIVEDGGRDVGAIVSLADLRRLRNDDHRRAMADAALGRVSNAFADVPIDELEREVATAIAEVRADARREPNPSRGG